MELNIPQEVLDKVMYWVNHKDMEVSGFGRITHDKVTNVFTVVDAYLLHQEGGATHTDIDDASLAKLMYDTRNVAGELAWWWHSHVKMPVFWSGTDRETIQDLGKQGWIVASVFNQRDEVHSALCYQTKAHVTTESDFGVSNEEKISCNFVDDLKTYITNATPEDPRHAVWAADYGTHVKEKTYTYTKPTIGIAGKDKIIQVGDHQLTEKEWDTFTQDTKFNTVDQWRAANPISSPSLIHSAHEAYSHWCVTCGEHRSECDCDTWDKVNYKDPGLLGYGIEAEAKALGMTSKGYLTILNDKSTSHKANERIRKMEDKLDAAVRTGKLQ